MKFINEYSLMNFLNVLDIFQQDHCNIFFYAISSCQNNFEPFYYILLGLPFYDSIGLYFLIVLIIEGQKIYTGCKWR